MQLKLKKKKKMLYACIKLLAMILFLQYKTEKDGVIETRIERKMVITSDSDDIDHDAVSQFHIRSCLINIFM